MFDDLGSCGEGLLLHCCLVSVTASIAEGKTTVYENFSRYILCCLLSVPCNACVQTLQRNKIRRKYGISVEETPLGEFCDGLLLDYCVVQFCPCLSLIQHVNHLKQNQKPAFLLCADEDTISLALRTPAQLKMDADEGAANRALEEKRELEMFKRHKARTQATGKGPPPIKKAQTQQAGGPGELRFSDTAAQVANTETNYGQRPKMAAGPDVDWNLII
jgi:Cys-rich protein (TIGR01571 family)